MKKALQISVILLLVAGVLFIKNYLKPTEILYSGTIENQNIIAPVEVYFDDYGVPHIFAENDDDMFFVAGYLGARDRLFQMAMLRVVLQVLTLLALPMISSGGLGTCLNPKETSLLPKPLELLYRVWRVGVGLH